MGWIGVDLDGTLAEYAGWQGPMHIGKPIPKMLGRVKEWLEEGKEVRVFTARVAEDPHGEWKRLIEEWCRYHLGQTLPVTNVKDYGMIELWDDRAIQVIANTGERADGR
jgi:hypothetical protein